MEWNTIHVAETDSTNRYLKETASRGNTAVWADFQTAGRGCGTNRWESERGKNLLFSVCIHPQHLPATRQFLLLETMALAVKDVLGSVLPAQGLTVKWPNDIYWNDRKLAGTLSECTLRGQHIDECIIGTGINLNQTVFLSDAPNPISVVQICGQEQEPEAILLHILDLFGSYLHEAEADGGAGVHAAYCSSLYRSTGFHAYRDVHGLFEARLLAVEPGGTLVLCDRRQRQRRYAFKEVSFII